MHCSLFNFTLVLNSVLLFCKLLVIELLLAISETLLRSVSAPEVEVMPLLDAHQKLTLLAGMLIYLEPNFLI
jgi:hypothetical protein